MESSRKDNDAARMPPPLPVPVAETHSTAEAQRKLQTSLAGFMIMMGVILGLGLWALTTQARPEPRTVGDSDIRVLAGWTVGVVAGLLFVTGLLFTLIPHKIFVWLGIAWCVLFLLAHWSIMLSAGMLPTDPMSLFFVAIPILMWIRGRKFRSIPAGS